MLGHKRPRRALGICTVDQSSCTQFFMVYTPSVMCGPHHSKGTHFKMVFIYYKSPRAILNIRNLGWGHPYAGPLLKLYKGFGADEIFLIKHRRVYAPIGNFINPLLR